MEYINKIQDHLANPIIDSYLKNVRIPDVYHVRCVYQGFSRDMGRDKLINKILLPEQKGLCCYCMKDLKDFGTIEHIIPESVTIAEMTHYFSHNLTGLNSSNICHTKDFVEGHSLSGQYPHEVSYRNFVMACRNCNSERGNANIYPLFLVSNIKNEVDYNRQTGKVLWRNDPNYLNPTVEILELNDNQLKAIRSLWIYGHDNPKPTYSTPNTIHNKTEREELIYRAFGNALLANIEIDIDAYLSLLTDEGWRKTLMYSYFASI